MLLSQLAGAVDAALDPLPAMHRVLEQALVVVPAGDGAAVQLVTDDGFTCACGAGTSADRTGARLARRGSLSGLAAQRRVTVCSEDFTWDRRALRGLRRRRNPVSVLCAPLEHRGEVFGVLEVSSRERAAFSREDVGALSRLAGFVATMLGGVFALARTPASPADNAPAAAAPAGRARGAVDVTTVTQIDAVITAATFEVHGQPIVDLRSGHTIMIEALTRFSAYLGSPDVWFSQARRYGRGVALEMAALERAIELHRSLGHAVPLAVNVSAEAIASPALRDVLDSVELDRIILELTEHLPVRNYSEVRRTLHRARTAGMRLAVDDTGAGFSSLQHIINLAPDIIKLDRQITHTIDADPVRQYLTEAFVTFAARTGATVIAEGIETRGELDALRALGIDYGQGFFIAPTVPLPQVALSFEHLAPRARLVEL